MRLFDWLTSVFKRKKQISVSALPSQGLFYQEDFKLYIKSADAKDIMDYERNYDSENISAVLLKLKSIVEKNVILSPGYSFNHIKSIDIVYIFLEIVKMTKKKPVVINYYDDEKGTVDGVDFSKENFNYFVVTEELINLWNPSLRCFEIEGYRVTLPSIGIENSLTNFLIEKSYEKGAERFNGYSYDFTFFLDGKDILRFDEIENLIQIFNFDIDSDERSKVERAASTLKPMQRYSLRKNGKIIDLSAKINLEKIWK